jgi:hypothetical protein
LLAPGAAEGAGLEDGIAAARSLERASAKQNTRAEPDDRQPDYREAEQK